MKRLNFITNQNPAVISGGWSGISQRMYEQLSRKFEVNYVHSINPPSNKFEKAASKLKRTIGMKGRFHFFSDGRLIRVSDLVSERCKEGDIDFYFGQTPWIKCQMDRPYAVYLDAAFPTYMELYSNPKEFSMFDLQRISKLEEFWLSKASWIFWGSNWAKNEAEKYYKLPSDTSRVIWVGGNVKPPDFDAYTFPDDNAFIFTFISLDFIKKGGWVCVKAFNLLKKEFPNATLQIIGQEPPADVLDFPGITYAGYLRKTVEAERQRFEDLLSRSTFMIHPTVMDTMGAVIIESGYFGCPSIAPKSFGIPELIKDGVTGYLVNVPFSEIDFYSPLSGVLNDKSRYLEMRRQVREFTTADLVWDTVGDIINSNLCN